MERSGYLLTQQWCGGRLAPPLLHETAGRSTSARSHSGCGQELGESGSHSGGTHTLHQDTHVEPSPTKISIQYIYTRFRNNSLQIFIVEFKDS